MNRNGPRVPAMMPTNPMMPLAGGNSPYAAAPQMPPQADPVAIALARRNALPPVPEAPPQAPPPAMGPVGSPLEAVGQMAQQAAPMLAQRFQDYRAGQNIGPQQGRAGERLANLRDRFPQAFDRAQKWRAGENVGPGFGGARPVPGNPPPRPRTPFGGGVRG